MGSWHPESPARLSSIQDQLIGSGLEPHLDYRQAPLASREAIARAHDQDYLDRLEKAVPAEGYEPLDPDTFLNPYSWQAALRAAGAVIEATDLVMRGELRNAFCAVRPPGHHARPGAAMGFCFLNNVAIGVHHALAVHGLKRVAVVDFDVHHGNGTEEILMRLPDDASGPAVMMVSFFQHPFYPYSGTDNPRENMVNIPLPAGSNAERVRPLVDEVWVPRLDAFAPELIFISAGFDAHREDDIGQMNLVEADFAYMTRRIMEVADRHAQGRIVSTLEGGYNLSSLARSVVAHVRTLAQL